MELARDFSYKLDFKENVMPKTYRALPQIKPAASDKAVKYFKSRGISEETTRKYNLTVRADNDKIMVFPFYSETGLLTFVKYRNTDYTGRGNKEWCEEKTKPILFGMNHCQDFERLVITEGQIDSLTLAECGIKNQIWFFYIFRTGTL